MTGVWGKGVGRCARCSAMAAGRGVGEPLPPIQRAGKGVEGETVTQRDAKGPEGTAPLPRHTRASQGIRSEFRNDGGNDARPGKREKEGGSVGFAWGADLCSRQGAGA